MRPPIKLKRKTLHKHLKSAARRVTARRRLNLFSWRWREAFVALGFWAIFSALPSQAQALAITGASLTGTNITYELGGVPNGTTVAFTIDSPGQVEIAIDKVQNVADTGERVATIVKTFTVQQSTEIFWNALWIIDGEPARKFGQYRFTITLSTAGASTAVVSNTLVQINSVDIHSVTLNGVLDPSTQNLTFPYSFAYALAKDAKVSVAIYNSSDTFVRQLLNDQPQSSEVTSSHTVTWDGIDAGGTPVPLGTYYATFDAKDLSNGGTAIQRVRSFAVLSLATGGLSPQQIFDKNAFVFPNPIRDDQATFQYQPVRDGAGVSLRIYTIQGTLVFDKTFPASSTGVTQNFVWDVTNAAGRKLGRGLYFYVLRESDPQGVLQVTKKLVIIR